MKVSGPLSMPVLLPIEYVKEKFIYSCGNRTLVEVD